MTDPAESVAVLPASPVVRAWQWCVRWRYVLGVLAVVTVFSLSSSPNVRPPRVRGLDKAQHVVEYVLLALVFLNVATRGFVRVRASTLGAAWLTGLAVAVLDETYQRWVPGRRFDPWDAFASSVGVTLAVLAVLVLCLLWPRLRSRA